MRNNINLPKLNINVYSNKIKNNEDDTFFEMLTQIKTSRNRNRLESNTVNYSHKRVFSENQKITLESENTEEDFFRKNPKIMSKLYGKNYSHLYEKIKEEVNLSKNDSKILNIRKPKEYFKKTKYSSPDSLNEFYIKFRKFKIVDKKDPIKKLTPTLAFIKSCNNDKIIPNPLGLIKRKGDEQILNMNNQHVGDRYFKALSDGLEFINHLNDVQLSNNRLTENGVTSLFNSLNNNHHLMDNIVKLNLSNNKIGNLGSEELINYLINDRCVVEELNVENNNLKDNNIINISNALLQNRFLRIKYLNLGNNDITDSSAKAISNLISDKKNLAILILRFNNLCNKGATIILNKIKNLPNIKVLDLSWNKIGNDLTKEVLFEEIVNEYPSDSLRKFPNYELNKCFSAMKLEFKKNPLSIDNTKKSVISTKPKDLKQSILPKIKVNVPERKPSNFAKELSSYLSMKNNPLVHLDISNNNLPFEDCNLIAKESKNNHSLLGIHLDGNEMTIDSLGFITPIKKKNLSIIHLYNKLDSDLNLIKTNIDNVRKIRSNNKCWICEGWREIEFTFKFLENIIDPQFHIVKIHLSIDDYKPYDMFGNGSKYNIIRMCPPGNVYYFFTVDGIVVDNYNYLYNYCNKDDVLNCENHPIQFTFDDNFIDEFNNIKLRQRYSKQSLELNNDNIKEIIDKYNNENTNNNINITTENNINDNSIKSEEDNNNNFKRDIKVNCLGKKIVKFNPKVLNEDYVKNLKYCEPRPIRKFDRFVKPRTPWTYPISIWYYYGYGYEGDTEDYIDKCFEHDFKRCQFEKDFKKETDLQELKTLLRNNYRNIIDCYKTLSSYSGFSIWQISQSTLTEFVNKCNNLVDKKYDINNIFLVETGITASMIDKEEKTKNNNKNLCDNLVRHQFMSLLVKVPKDKYIRTLKTMEDTLEAVKYSFENHYNNAIIGYDHHKWRKERYYNEKVDNFLKAYLPLLDGVYHSYAKQKGPRKKE